MLWKGRGDLSCVVQKKKHTVKAACLSASTVVSMLLCFEKFALVIPQ